MPISCGRRPADGRARTDAGAEAYGLVKGRVRKLGRDAASPQQAATTNGVNTTGSGAAAASALSSQGMEFAYPAKVTLDQDFVTVDGRREPIRPGMRIAAEIRTGDRRIIEYLLSPVVQAMHEAGRER